MKSLVQIIAILATAFVVVAIVYLVFRQPPFDQEFAICYEPIPENRKIGISGERKEDGTVALSLAGEVNQPNTPTDAQLQAFLQCVEKIAGRGVVLTNFVRLPIEPIGQVANRWARETGGPKVLFDPGGAKELNLLRVGPVAGTKADVVTRWCGANTACVSCDPAVADKDTVQVLVSLLSNAPLVEKELPSESGDPWPIPPPGTTSEPWQKIDQEGRRFYLECQPKS